MGGAAVRRALARWRWAGLGVVWDAARPEPEPLTAVATTVAQVSLTVIHVEAGAYLNVGGLIYDPRILAVPQQRDAIATPITEGEQA
jgi:hypothetical protein